MKTLLLLGILSVLLLVPAVNPGTVNAQPASSLCEGAGLTSGEGEADKDCQTRREIHQITWILVLALLGGLLIMAAATGVLAYAYMP